jgi:hypothetical protein
MSAFVEGFSEHLGGRLVPGYLDPHANHQQVRRDHKVRDRYELRADHVGVRVENISSLESDRG